MFEVKCVLPASRPGSRIFGPADPPLPVRDIESASQQYSALVRWVMYALNVTY
jgi:hypothetical protein